MARSVSRGPQALGDTSVFIALEQGRQLTTSAPSELAISSVTVAELTVGVLLASTTVERARRLAILIKARSRHPLSIDESVAAAWAELRVALCESKRKLPINDSWIAATVSPGHTGRRLHRRAGPARDPRSEATGEGLRVVALCPDWLLTRIVQGGCLVRATALGERAAGRTRRLELLGGRRPLRGG